MPSDESLRRPGVVRALRDDVAVVGVVASGCSACGRQSACAIGRLAADRAEQTIELSALPGLKPGDAVDIEIAGEDLVSRAVVVYLLPVIGLLTGAGLGDTLAGNPGALIGALAGLAAGLLPSRMMGRLTGGKLRLRHR